MKNLPLVSIGLPTYNRAARLRRAIESVLAQDYSKLELVISDNASTDETRALCEEYQRADSRVRYLRQAVNRGFFENFKNVFVESRGEFFMWLADDDWIDRDYVSSCVGFLLERPDYQLACGGGKYFSDGEFRFREADVNLTEESGRRRVLSFYRRVAMNGAFYGVMRRGAITELSSLRSIAGDWLLLSHVAFRGKVKTLPDTSINRSLGGVSQDAESLGRRFGLSDFWKRHVYIYIASVAFRDVAWQSAAFEKLGKASRWLLACRVALGIVANNSLPPWLRVHRLLNDLRARLILRTRLRLLFRSWTDRGSRP